MAAGSLVPDAYLTDEKHLSRVLAAEGQWVHLEDCSRLDDDGQALLERIGRSEVLRSFRTVTPTP